MLFCEDFALRVGLKQGCQLFCVWGCSAWKRRRCLWQAYASCSPAFEDNLVMPLLCVYVCAVQIYLLKMHLTSNTPNLNNAATVRPVKPEYFSLAVFWLIWIWFFFICMIERQTCRLTCIQRKPFILISFSLFLLVYESVPQYAMNLKV